MYLSDLQQISHIYNIGGLHCRLCIWMQYFHTKVGESGHIHYHVYVISGTTRPTHLHVPQLGAFSEGQCCEHMHKNSDGRNYTITYIT